jgi:hypothetical protein
MQETTPAFDTEKARDGQEPILLLTLSLTGETRYLANRGVTVDGQGYTELLVDGVEIEQSGAFGPDSSDRPPMGNVRIVLSNADDVTGTPFSDVLATRTLIGRRAALRQEYIDSAGVPLPLADTLPLIDGLIVLPEEGLFTDTDFALEIVDGSDAWHKELGTPIAREPVTITIAGFVFPNANAFPNAPEESLGKIQPMLYGAVEKSPCVPVDIGARTTLAAAITDTDVAATLTDGSRFPAAGSVWIDEEEVAYAAKSGNTLTGLTRGDPAIPHDQGSAVVQKLADYIWRVADDTVTVSAVYIRQRGGTAEDWLRLDAGDWSLEYDEEIIIPD